MLRLYDYFESGNCYKVRLLLAHQGIRYERVPVDILKGETRTDGFLARNPNQQVPLLEWPDGRCLAESNAILFYLADSTSYLPDNAWERAQALKWLFFEQYSHEPYIAVVRFWRFAGLLAGKDEILEEKMQRGYHALQVMEKHLCGQSFFAGGRYSIADIALYAYTHVAHEGGFDLAPLPAVGRWLKRVREQPGHVTITA